jgi:diguanylate cyclase (GGDEF)-like protein/PAS domain S-box-containing protein
VKSRHTRAARGVARRSRDGAASSSALDALAILDAAPVHVAVLDASGTIVAVNDSWRSFARQNGMVTADQGVGQNYLDACDAAGDAEEGSARRAAQGIRDVLEDRASEFTLEYPCHGPAQQRWFRMRVRPLAGRRIGARAVVFHLEVTDAQQLRERAESRESWLKEMTDNVGDVLFLVDIASGHFLYVSRAYEEIWQRPRSALHADLWSWAETLHPEDRQSALDIFATGLRQGRYALQYRIVHPDGSVRWLETHGWPVYDATGRFVHLAGVTKDITERKHDAQALEDSRRRLAGIVESAMDAILTVDASQRIVICNPAAETMFGYSAAELIGQPLDVLLPAPVRTVHARRMSDFGRELAHVPVSGRHRPMGPDRQVKGVRKSGEEFPAEVSISMDDSTGQALYTAILRDQTERQAAQERILYLSRMHAMLSGVNLLMLRERDTARLFDEACRIAVEAGGFSTALICLLGERGRLELAGAAGAAVDSREEIKGILRADQADHTLAAQVIREKRCIVSNDATHDPRILCARMALGESPGSVAVIPLVVGTEAVGAMMLYAARPDLFHEEEQRLIEQLAADIAFGIDHINKERRLHQLAYFDPVTGLANRALFLERLQQRLDEAAVVPGDHAVFVANIERFRDINEALGRSVGDALLRMVGGWVAQHVANAEAVARVDGDEFAMVVTWVPNDAHSTAVLQQRISAFNRHAFEVQGSALRLAVRVGAALATGRGSNAESLLRNAQTALREARNRAERLVFFSAGMEESAVERLAMENALRRASDENQFVLHFQPKRDLATGAIVGAEALIRWHDPHRGLVSPGKFVPLLEQTGLIRNVGKWVLMQALETRRQWQARVPRAPKIAVNVSAVQLRDAEFIDWLRQVVDQDPSVRDALELEITESVMMEDVRHTVGMLEAVRGLGIRIAIDDFGTGFSSLAYLAKLPVDCLKIDGSFIRDMETGPEALSLVSTIINLAHSLRLEVVAEGVETTEQARLLRLLGCNQIQGYLLSPPVPASEFLDRFVLARG